MICPNCGTENSQEYKFCVKCGGDLSSSNNTMMNSNQNNLTSIYGMPLNNNNQAPNNNNNNTFGFNLNSNNNQNQSMNMGMNNNSNMNMGMNNDQNMNMNNNQPMNNNNGFNTNPTTMPIGNNINNLYNTNSNPINKTLFKTILNTIIKPVSITKEELSIFDDFKASGITAVLITVLATIIFLIKTIIDVVRIPGYGDKKYTWDWDMLKYFDFFKYLGTMLLVFAGIIVLLAGTYYVASIIIKKKTKFQKLLALCAISILPVIITTTILSPILTKIYLPLGLITSGAGIIYTIVILFEHVNKELSLDDDKKVYVNLASLAAFILIAYFVATKIMSSIIGTDITIMSDIFG